MQFLIRPPKLRCLSDALPWGFMLEPDVVITKQVEFMKVLRYIPLDLSSSSPEQLVSARSALNRAIKQFGSGWAFWFACQRLETRAYDNSDFPDPISRLIDEHRRQVFTAPGAQFESRYYVTILYAPAEDSVGALASHFEENLAERRTVERRFRAEYETFQRGVSALQNHLASFMPKVASIRGDELITYLHNRVSTRRQLVRMPKLPVFLSEFIVDDEYVSGWEPMLGNHHIRSIRIKSQPDETQPGILDELNGLDYPYDNTARWLPFDREDAQRELELRKKAWADRRKGLLQKVLARYFNDDGSRDNADATRRMNEADEALLALSSGDFSFGYWSQAITVSHPDIEEVEERCKRIQQILDSRGLISAVARSDAMSVWGGGLPGLTQGDLGRFLACSLTFAEVLPGTAVWAGPERDYHLDGPVLLRCVSDGGTPFGLALHQEGSDVGNTLIIGQIGAGKSVLLGSMIAAHRKYRGSRVVVIDRGASAKCITLALGGSFYALAANDSAVSLQPLAFIDEPEERAWAFEFIVGCLKQEGVEATPKQKQEIVSALESLSTRPVNQRTLTTLRAFIQDETGNVKLALGQFCLGGACGDLLDNHEYRLGLGQDVVCYETAALFERPSAVGPVMACVFHAIERTFDGRPLLLGIDELWGFLDNPFIAGKLRGKLKTARKENVQIVMATQSAADVANSNIREILSESCPRLILTANSRAMERAIAATYSTFGLTPKQIRIISELRPKDEYIDTEPGAWRKFRLALSIFELAFVGRNSPQDRREMDSIIARYPREEFPWRWLEYCGFSDREVSDYRALSEALESPPLLAAE